MAVGSHLVPGDRKDSVGSSWAALLGLAFLAFKSFLSTGERRGYFFFACSEEVAQIDTFSFFSSSYPPLFLVAHFALLGDILYMSGKTWCGIVQYTPYRGHV